MIAANTAIIPTTTKFSVSMLRASAALIDWLATGAAAFSMLCVYRAAGGVPT